ncbi:MAG: hypothetical protein K2X27_04390 [Candidatus Obscuribacterales bacterium]|nr:hypothetical protein [Candidatus Obscuribacterales bacterium]
MYEIIAGPFWILLAKSILAVIMSAFGLLCLLVLKKAGQWKEQLYVLETECNIARDSAMIQATVARSQLSELQEKLRHKPEKAEMEVVGNLAKHALPVLTLLMNKETNLLKWGFAGAKLAQSAFEYFSRKKNY